MYFKLFLILLLTIRSGNSSPAYCPYHSSQIIRVIPETEEHIDSLKGLTKFQWLHLEPWIKPTTPFVPALYSARKEMVLFVLEFCKKQGMNASVVVNDLQENILQLPRNFTSNRIPYTLDMHPSKFNLTVYHSWEEIEAFMNKLQETYPQMCTVITDREYVTSEGRSMKILKISPPGRTNNKGIFIDAAIHAREWIASSIATYMAYQLTVGYERSEEIKNLVNDVTWYIMPVLNIDGYKYSWETDRMWRKSRSTADRCTSKATKLNDPTCICQGVDLNRNWNSAWNSSDSCSHPCCNTYPGLSPMSEPEVKSVASFLTKNQDKIQAYISLHNYGQLWMYPYSSDERKVVKRAHLQYELGEMIIQQVRNVHGTNYTLGSAAKTLYKYSGSSTDWVVDNTNISYSYIVETRPASGGFCLDENEIKDTSEEIFEGIKLVSKAIVGKVNLTGAYGKHFHSLAEKYTSSANHLETFSYFLSFTWCVIRILTE